MTRRPYVTGHLGVYLTPTVAHCDATLRRLAAMLTEVALSPAKADRVWHDIDIVLERRHQLLETT